MSNNIRGKAIFPLTAKLTQPPPEHNPTAPQTDQLFTAAVCIFIKCQTFWSNKNIVILSFSLRTVLVKLNEMVIKNVFS